MYNVHYKDTVMFASNTPPLIFPPSVDLNNNDKTR